MRVCVCVRSRVIDVCMCVYMHVRACVRAPTVALFCSTFVYCTGWCRLVYHCRVYCRVYHCWVYCRVYCRTYRATRGLWTPPTPVLAAPTCAPRRRAAPPASLTCCSSTSAASGACVRASVRACVRASEWTLLHNVCFLLVYRWCTAYVLRIRRLRPCVLRLYHRSRRRAAAALISQLYLLCACHGVYYTLILCCSCSATSLISRNSLSLSPNPHFSTNGDLMLYFICMILLPC